MPFTLVLCVPARSAIEHGTLGTAATRKMTSTSRVETTHTSGSDVAPDELDAVRHLLGMAKPRHTVIQYATA